MNPKILISFKTENILINELSRQDNIEMLKESGFIKSLFSKKKYTIHLLCSKKAKLSGSSNCVAFK